MEPQKVVVFLRERILGAGQLQPILVSASTASGTPILKLTYNFNLGNGVTGSDNGNVIQIANGKDSNRTQNFVYDPLNRIWQAYTNGTNWGETYSPTKYAAGTAFSAANAGIDAWGNLTNRSGVTGKTGSENPFNCAPANVENQLNTCYTYDAAGNIIKNGTTTYTYDAENRLIAIPTAHISYVYDGDGNRIEKCTEGTTPGTCSSTATGTFYWLHEKGGTLNESDLGGNFTAAYDRINGQIAARIDLPGNVVHYYFHDRLNSTNIVTGALGNIQNESDYYPYGGEIVITDTDSNRYKFTGKERDTESGLDMFGARYYGSSLGRFMTPDWEAKPTDVPYASFGNPQSLNLYSYVDNNPTTTRDPEVLSCTIEFGAGGSVFGPVGTAIGATIGAGVGLFVTYEVVKAVSSTIHQSDSNTAPAPGTTEQGRDAQGRFLPKEPGQTQPGAQTEKETLAAEGATKNTAPLPGTNRIPDGTVDATGQKIEVKSGQSVSNTGQLVQAGQAAQAATGQPLLVVTTNPNVHVSAPAQQNPNLQIRPAKQDPPSQ